MYAEVRFTGAASVRPVAPRVQVKFTACETSGVTVAESVNVNSGDVNWYGVCVGTPQSWTTPLAAQHVACPWVTLPNCCTDCCACALVLYPSLKADRSRANSNINMPNRPISLLMIHSFTRQSRAYVGIARPGPGWLVALDFEPAPKTDLGSPCCRISASPRYPHHWGEQPT